MLSVDKPVDCEEEMIDTDHDGVPGGNHVTPTGGEPLPFTMHSKLCQIENEAWGVGYEED